jgi:hypothetical protein
MAMSDRNDSIQGFASRCRELADTCTTAFAKEALIETAERVEATIEGGRPQIEAAAAEPGSFSDPR